MRQIRDCMYKRMTCLIVTVMAILWLVPIQAAASPDKPTEAQVLDIYVSIDGAVVENLSKASYADYDDSVQVGRGGVIEVSCSRPMLALYVIWEKPPGEWTLMYGDISRKMGTSGFLHEYCDLKLKGAKTCTLTVSKGASICGLWAFGAGALPHDVQVWNPPCKEADMLILSTHADDEILYLGGPMVIYANKPGVKVQVAYMRKFRGKENIREHEKLDGLWECGVNNYPTCGDFYGLYSMKLEDAMAFYDYDAIVAFVTEQIRMFKPPVCVTQDFNGEYGHCGHKIFVKAVSDAVASSGSDAFCPESAALYGTWDVPKTYMHLYEQDSITLNLRVPVNNHDSRTALEILKDAYAKHVSQQYCTFKVDDEYKHSPGRFGLYRSAVGADNGSDMLEHVETWAQKKQRL